MLARYSFLHWPTASIVDDVLWYTYPCVSEALLQVAGHSGWYCGQGFVSVRVVNEKDWKRPKNQGAERVGSGEGVSPSPVGECPLPRIFLIFFSGNGAFWALVLFLCANCQLVSYLTWRTYHGKLVNNWSIQKKTTGTAFPSDSSPGICTMYTRSCIDQSTNSVVNRTVWRTQIWRDKVRCFLLKELDCFTSIEERQNASFPSNLFKSK